MDGKRAKQQELIRLLFQLTELKNLTTSDNRLLKESRMEKDRRGIYLLFSIEEEEKAIKKKWVALTKDLEEVVGQSQALMYLSQI